MVSPWSSWGMMCKGREKDRGDEDSVALGGKIQILISKIVTEKINKK